MFGYRGTPTKRTLEILETVAERHGVCIMAIIQATHTFDVNACDVLYHSCQKRRMREFKAPLCQAHIKRDFYQATQDINCDGRTIQRSFWRALRRNEKGDIDESLIPQTILDWYEDSGDEDDTFEEVASDVECD